MFCYWEFSKRSTPFHFRNGKSIKATDLSCVPLIHPLHCELHQKGKLTFQTEHNIDLKDAMILNLMKYICLLEKNNPDDYDWPLTFD